MSSVLNPLTDHQEDIHLWRQCKDGSQSAFARLFHIHYQDLYTYGVKISGRAALTEDCIQDTFLTLWQTRERLGDIYSIRAYVFKSFRGRLFKAIQKSNTVTRRERQFEPEAHLEFSAEELLIHRQMEEAEKERIVAALNRLPTRQKEIMYLRFYKELSYDEIAEIIPLHYQSIRNCVYESLKTLRKYLLVFLFFLPGISG